MIFIICFIIFVVFCCIWCYQSMIWKAESERINAMLAKNYIEYIKQYNQANSIEIKEEK